MGYARVGHLRAGTGGVVAGIVVALTLAAPTPAAAGGADWLSPVRDRYEPGQQVILVGYTEPVAMGSTSTGDTLTDPDWHGRAVRHDPAAG